MDSLITALVRPLVRNFAQAGLGEKELLGGAIEYAELMWQTPPLVATAPLGGVPLHEYVDTRTPGIRPDILFEFWNEALKNCRLAPYKYADDDGWKQLSYIMPRMSEGERRLWLSPPQGFPAIDDYAGVTLSLECAHLMRYAVPVSEIVEDDNSYYVVTETGLTIGVANGLPIGHELQWDLSVAGMVPGLLSLPRGSGFVGCDYDLVAKLRSALHTHKDKVAEFEGCDQALQMLRVVAAGRHIAELAQRIKSLKKEAQRKVEVLRVLRDAVHLSEVYTISDRSRVLGLKAMLVPDIMTLSEFKEKLYAGDRVPPSLTLKSLTKLQTNLKAVMAAYEKAER